MSRGKRRGAPPRPVPANATVAGFMRTVVDAEFDGHVLSHEERRYAIVDADTGEVFDDAQGWGYRTKRNAYAALGHMRARAEGRPSRQQRARRWLKGNPAAAEALREYLDLNYRYIGEMTDDEVFEAALAGTRHGPLPEGVTPQHVLREL